MIDLDEFTELKKKVDQLKSSVDRAEGAVQQIKTQIKQEHGCENIEQAKEKQVKLTEEVASIEKNYNKELAKLQEKHPDLFEGD